MTPARILTAHERRRYAIGKARERRAAELAPLVAEVDRLVGEVGWHQARPVVETVLGPTVRVTGPRGRWRAKVGKRNGAAILAELAALPVQETLPLMSQRRRSLDPREDPCTS